MPREGSRRGRDKEKETAQKEPLNPSKERVALVVSQALVPTEGGDYMILIRRFTIQGAQPS